MANIFDRLKAVHAELGDILTQMESPSILPEKKLSSGPQTYQLSGSLHHEYSTVDPWSMYHDYMLLQHGYDGSVGLHDGVGLPIRMLPSVEVDSSSAPRWSRKEGNLFTFYSYQSNQLKQYDAKANKISVIKTFSQYKKITEGVGAAKADVSFDGEHRILIGDDREVFVYNMKSDQTYVARTIPQNSGQVSLYMTPDNNVLWMSDQGTQLFDINGKFVRQITRGIAHSMPCRDQNGDEVLIWTNSAENPVILPNYQNGIIKIRLADAQQQGLLAIGWSKKNPPEHQAVHISCPDQTGWCLVTTYTPVNAQSTDLLANSLLKVSLDGKGYEILGKHGGQNLGDYKEMPKASVSHDGSRYCYTRHTDEVIVIL